jgi:micrococcal nuclease
MKYLPLILILFFVSCNGFKKRCIKVIDGDTLVMDDNTHIRLNNLDAPELHQFYGNQAKQFLSNLVLNKPITGIKHGKDKYGRTIADLYLNGLWINKLIVDSGYAYVYLRYDNENLYPDEIKAKNNRLGLWAYPNESPYIFRHNHLNK